MVRLADAFQMRTTTGDPITAGGVTVRPQSQALVVRWGEHGGLVWNRPLAVLVERAGQTERIPIMDVTRLAQLSLLGASLLTMAIVWLLSNQHRRKAT